MLPTLTQIKANDHREELVRAARNHRRARQPNARIVTDELIPALEAEPGYTSAVDLPDQANGDRLTIALFQTDPQRRRALAGHPPGFLSIGRRLVAATARHRH